MTDHKDEELLNISLNYTSTDINDDKTNPYCINTNKIFDIKSISTLSINNDDTFLINNTIIFYKVRTIANGSYGKVNAYKNNNDEYIAIKSSISNDHEQLNDEYNILQYLIEHNICKNVYVPSKSFKINNKIYIIMEYMSGTLGEYVTHFYNTPNLKYYNILPIILEICLSIVKLIYCLAHHKLYYTDLKLNNILIRCDSNVAKHLNITKIYLALCDLGSIVNYNNIEKQQLWSTTFPPPNYFQFYPSKSHLEIDIIPNRDNYLKQFDTQDLSWIVGVNLAIILGLNEKLLVFSNYKFTYKQITESDIFYNLITNDLLKLKRMTVKDLL